MALNHEVFDRFKKNVEHEDDLLNYRTSWLLISQSFLLAAFITSSSTVPESTQYVIKVLGTVIAVTSGISTLAAIIALSKIRKQVSEMKFDQPVPLLLSGVPIHWMGLCAPVVLHPVFAAVWWII